MIACICGGIGELLLLIFLGISGGLTMLYKHISKKHGTHGDQNCDCDCHTKDK